MTYTEEKFVKWTKKEKKKKKRKEVKKKEGYNASPPPRGNPGPTVRSALSTAKSVFIGRH
jgi:hypothetical protein